MRARRLLFADASFEQKAGFTDRRPFRFSSTILIRSSFNPTPFYREQVLAMIFIMRYEGDRPADAN